MWLVCGGVAHVNCCSLLLESAHGLSSNLLWLYVCRSLAVLVPLGKLCNKHFLNLCHYTVQFSVENSCSDVYIGGIGKIANEYVVCGLSDACFLHYSHIYAIRLFVTRDLFNCNLLCIVS